MNHEELLWNVSIDDLKEGFTLFMDNYVCLCCHETFELDNIYKHNNQLVNAKKAVKIHVKEKHESMFKYLISMDKKYTGLTDNQKCLVEMFYQGLSDKEIVKIIGGSTSTIRNQRFSLREKAKQAKIYLSIMDLLEGELADKNSDKFVNIHRFATNVDERYAITENERKTYLKTYFDGDRLVNFPSKQKRIIVILQHIVKYFEINKKYSEKEVNEILKAIYHDFVTIRRYLIEYGFLDRLSNCSEYWVKI